ncbi:MAG: hypothetical protein ACREVL_15855 [Solimonas sp.]
MEAGPRHARSAAAPLRGALVRLLLAAVCTTATATVRPVHAVEDQDDHMAPAPTGAMAGNAPAPRYTSAAPHAGGRLMTAAFSSFGGDALNIAFSLPADAGRQSLQEFGISEAETDAMLKACLATPACDQDEFDRQITRYYNEHALRLRPVPGQAPRLYVDVAQVVRRNRERVQPVAAALRQLAAQRGADSQWAVEAAIAMVQTGLTYRRPASAEDGRRILGFYPPPRALERGYGDCDSKSALLAAILQNLTSSKLIGVHVPQHYLIGIAGTPDGQQAFLDYGGQRYVLVEAAGPGMRRPGSIADATRSALAARDGLRIDPLF